MLCSIAASSSPCNSGSLSVLILESQKLMRRYAEKELTEAFHHKPNAAAVAELVHSCVSQRDIQVCCLTASSDSLISVIASSTPCHVRFASLSILYNFCLF